jgi:putative ABC transport system ATP-binding protein
MTAPQALTARGTDASVSSAVLEARTLYRFYRAGDEEILALQGVSLEVRPGEVLAVVGPSGCGKSTLLHCLAGLDDPSGGSVWVAGKRLSHQPEQLRARLRAAHLGVLFQSGNLIGHLTVAENVRLAQSLTRGRAAPAAELLSSLGIDRRAHAYPGQLSGGEAARAGLAVALANAPAVLLADEPTGELDTDTEEQLLDLLLARAATGTAVVIVSHSPAVARTATRRITLQDGRVVR